MLIFVRLILLLMSTCIVCNLYAETIPSILVNNYKNAPAYIMNIPVVVVGSNYEDACNQLGAYGYEWKIVPTTNANSACYSPTGNIRIGADTWYCADGTLAYYNIPWWSCSGFNACKTPAWTLSSDGRFCSRPNPICSATASTAPESQLLAAIVYGEASVNSTFEEKAAIANAIIRKRNAMGYASVNELVTKKKYYSAAVKNNNIRYRLALCANIQIEYPELDAAVQNALDPNGIDYANGGCYWDGLDLKTLGSKQLHYMQGYIFTDPLHDVLFIGDTPPMNIQGDRATYNYTYESTAGYGSTVFWKLTNEFMTGQGVKQCH